MDIDKMIDLPMDATKTDEMQSFLAEGICSGPLGHDSEIRIKWRADKKQLANQRLDFSVHKNGLVEGRYTTLFPANAKAGFRPAKLTEPKFEGKTEVLPAIEKLQIYSFGPEQPIQKGRKSKPEDRNQLVLVLRNCEPGLNYFIRLMRMENDTWIQGPVIRVEAPVCPSDDF